MALEDLSNSQQEHFKKDIEKFKLKKGDPRTKEIASMGGKKAAENRKRKKDMKQTLEILLNLASEKGESTKVDDIDSLDEMIGKNITTQDAILLSMINLAKKGDVKAACFIRDTVGDAPNNKVDLNANIDTNQLDDILKQLSD